MQATLSYCFVLSPEAIQFFWKFLTETIKQEEPVIKSINEAAGIRQTISGQQGSWRRPKADGRAVELLKSSLSTGLSPERLE